MYHEWFNSQDSILNSNSLLYATVFCLNTLLFSCHKKRVFCHERKIWIVVLYSFYHFAEREIFHAKLYTIRIKKFAIDIHVSFYAFFRIQFDLKLKPLFVSISDKEFTLESWNALHFNTWIYYFANLITAYLLIFWRKGET